MKRRFSLLALVSAMATCAFAQPNLDALTREFRGQEKAQTRTAAEQQAAYEQVLGGLLVTVSDETNDEGSVNKRAAAQQLLQEIALRTGRPNAEAERAPMVKALIAKLATTTNLYARTWLIRQLQWIGKADAVAALTALLGDAEIQISDAARRALVKNPSDEARDALRGMLAKATVPAAQIAYLNALCERNDAGSVPAIAKLVASGDAEVVNAAAYALGRLGGAQALAALSAARDKAPAAARYQVEAGWLLAADSLLATDKAAAAKVYEAALATDSKKLKAAGLVGLSKARGEAAVDTLLAAVKGDDWFLASTGLRALLNVTGAATTRKLADAVAGLSPAVAVQALRNLAERGDTAALPQVLAAAGNADEGVKVAAINALAKVGDKTAVAPLADLVANNGGNVEAACRSALGLCRADGFDAAILDVLRGADGKKRDEMVRALAARRSATAVPALVKVAGEDANEGVRIIAIEALGVLADPAQYAPLVKVLVGAKSDKERASAEKTVVATQVNVADVELRAKPVLDALTTATGAVKASLLRVLGATGAPAALPVLRTATKDADAAIAAAAVAGLAAWPTADPMADLLVLAKADGPAKNDALAGYLRMINLTKQGADERAKLFADALALAGRREEKRLVAIGLGDVNCLAALQQLNRLLDDEPAIAEECGQSVLKVGTMLRGANPDEVRAVASNARELVRDKRLVGDLDKLLAAVSKGFDAVVAWMLSPAYDQAGKTEKDLFDIAFDPEKPDATVQWTPIAGNADNGGAVIFDGKPFFGDNKVIYAKAQVQAPKAMEAEFQCGSDDGIKVFLNGKVVHGANVNRGLTPGEDKFRVQLNEGWNTVLVKITNGGGNWSFNLQIRDTKGAKIETLKSKAE
ncbi:MAG: HEAT repeat domain-containing protein [Armatimonadetes bacterium]|nr:HEAT repeat domain-containing protein [Armatimonadota bacterium]